MNEFTSEDKADLEPLEDFGEHLIRTVELLAGLQERLFQGLALTDTQEKTAFEKLDELLELSVEDFNSKHRETFERHKEDRTSRMTIELAYFAIVRALHLRSAERTFDAYLCLFNAFRYMGAAVPRFVAEHIPPSTVQAASTLASVSSRKKREEALRFMQRFRELGLTKNRAAPILAKEFAITEERARKKLQGVVSNAVDHG
jgi:hypothetical protein